MLQFDPRSPYHRRMWHYESDRPLSVAQLVALGSLDARTAALLWLLIERHRSVIVSGPTDPTPGVGKTTTLNALLGFLPAGSTLVYTMGMFEDFTFCEEVEPASTCVLANEVSDHLRIYMWGRAARQLLRLPEQGFAIATSCHADTIDDVLAMLRDDLRLGTEDVGHLGIIINIGLVGRMWPPRRRFLTVNYLLPADPPGADPPGADPPRRATPAAATGGTGRDGPRLVSLARWDARQDVYIPATDETLDQLAPLVGLAPEAFRTALQRRIAAMEEMAEGRGAGPSAMRAGVDALAAVEAQEAGQGDAPAGADEQVE